MTLADLQPKLNFSAVAVAAVLAVGLFFAAETVATAWQVVKAPREIGVTGAAETVASADIAKWQGSFARRVGSTELAAGAKKVEADRKALEELLLQNGLTAAEIKFDPIWTGEQYENFCERQENGWENCVNRLTGYQISQGFWVESKNVTAVAAAASAVANFLAANDLLNFSGAPQYFFTAEKLQELKLTSLTAAAKNARQRAEIIAENAGGEIKNMQSANMGVFQITPVNSDLFEDYGVYDTTTVEKKVSGVLRVKFTLAE